MHSYSLSTYFILTLLRIILRGTSMFLGHLAEAEAAMMLTVQSPNPLRTFICSYGTEQLPCSPSHCTMRSHKGEPATGVCPACLLTLLTFWGLFVSHRRDTGSEAEEMTDKVHNNRLLARGLLDFPTALAEGFFRKSLSGHSLISEVTKQQASKKMIIWIPCETIKAHFLVWEREGKGGCEISLWQLTAYY